MYWGEDFDFFKFLFPAGKVALHHHVANQNTLLCWTKTSFGFGYALDCFCNLGKVVTFGGHIDAMFHLVDVNKSSDQTISLESLAGWEIAKVAKGGKETCCFFTHFWIFHFLSEFLVQIISIFYSGFIFNKFLARAPFRARYAPEYSALLCVRSGHRAGARFLVDKCIKLVFAHLSRSVNDCKEKPNLLPKGPGFSFCGRARFLWKRKQKFSPLLYNLLTWLTYISQVECSINMFEKAKKITVGAQ